MSTHRTRNQQRREQSVGANRTQPLQNIPSAPPKTFVKGIVIPLIINFVICFDLCLCNSILKKYTNIILSPRTVPLILLASLLAAIFIVVSYVIKQYKYLKGTYQSLEQGMAAAAILNAQQGDFVEYPVNGNIPNYAPSAQVTQAQNVQSTNGSSIKTGCAVSIIAVLVITAIMGAYLYFNVPKNFDVLNADLAAGTVVSKSKHFFGSSEDPNVEYTIEYTYSYKDEEYEGRDILTFPISEGTSVNVLVDVQNPHRCVLVKKVTHILKIWCVGIAIITVVWLLTFIDILYQKKRKQR